jgi:dethiobiotin synthetase
VGNLIFVTGTDTGVGKTLLTASLLHHLRSTGVHALALKPFCSGGTHDVDLLHALQDGELTRREINPFYFAEPVAPLIAARRLRRVVRLDQVTEHIGRLQMKCECLLVEGSGGLLVPLGKGYSVRDLIEALRCEVILVARNRLGTINHTLLTLRCLEDVCARRPGLALMDESCGDRSSRTNARTLAELVPGMEVWRVPYLGRGASAIKAMKGNTRKMKIVLARILQSGIFASRSLERQD